MVPNLSVHGKYNLILVRFNKISKRFLCVVVVVDVNNLKNSRKPLQLQKKVQQDALGKVNRVKDIRRRGKDGLKINRQPFVLKRQ